MDKSFLHIHYAEMHYGLPHLIMGLRRQLGWDQKQLADALGVTQPTVSRWEAGTVQPKLKQIWAMLELDPDAKHEDTATSSHRKQLLRDRWLRGDNPPQRISSRDFETATVVGACEAGVWRNATTWPVEQRYLVYFPVVAAYPGPGKYAYEVLDTHANKRFPPGSIIVIAPYEPGALPAHNDYVVVERNRDGVVETTCRIARYIDSDLYFWPDSSDDRHQLPFNADNGFGDHDDSLDEAENGLPAQVLGRVILGIVPVP